MLGRMIIHYQIVFNPNYSALRLFKQQILLVTQIKLTMKHDQSILTCGWAFAIMRNIYTCCLLNPWTSHSSRICFN